MYPREVVKCLPHLEQDKVILSFVPIYIDSESYSKNELLTV